MHATHPPAGVHELLSDPDWTYVDVRSTQEFEQGHVPGAYNVPLLHMGAGGMRPNPEFLAAMTRHFPKTRKLVLGCKSGGRSERACELLAQQGWTSLVNMAGGYHGAYDMGGGVLEQGWAACGYDTAREALPGRSWRDLQPPPAPAR